MSLELRMKTMALKRAAVKAEVPGPEEACNRRSRRKSMALPAQMTFNNLRLTVPCTVADMSGSGARIALSGAMSHQYGDMEHLPKRLFLVLRADRMQIDCEIVWRRSGQLGLRFLSPPRPLEAGKR